MTIESGTSPSARRAAALVLALSMVEACAAAGDPTAEPWPGSEAAQQAPQSPSVEETPYARSGSRLQAMHYVIDGAVQFRNLHDATLDANCEWARTSSGAVRCMPWLRTNLLFLDDACTQPAVPLGDSPDPRGAPGDGARRGVVGEGTLVSVPLDVDARAATCGTQPRLQKRASYRLLEQVSRAGRPPFPRAPRFELRDGGCRQAHDGGGAVPAIHRAEPVEEALFLEGSVERVAVGGGLALERARGSDGSEVTLGVLTESGSPCVLTPSGACVSGRVAAEDDFWSSLTTPAVSVFADAQCSQRALTDSRVALCGPPDYGLGRRDGLPRVYALRPLPGVFWSRDGAGQDCASHAFQASIDHPRYGLGADLTETFPAARAQRVGRGPFYRRLWAAAPTDRVVPVSLGSRFEDAARRACDVLDASDGSLRCYPLRFDYDESQLFSDSRCNDRLVQRKEGTTDTDGLIVAAGQGLYRPTVLNELRALEVYEGPVFGPAPACSPTERPAGKVLLKRAAVVPLSALPEVTLVAR